MKENYTKPEMEVVEFDTKDIMTCSQNETKPDIDCGEE